jgi:hypothetical protein
MTTTAKITRRSTMQAVLEAYPSAQRALFGRYHIGGCNSCGYQPEDILEEVAHGHNITDVDEVVAFIQEADEVDRRIQASPREVAKALRSSAPPHLVDVRTREEWDVTHIPTGSGASTPPRTLPGMGSGTSARTTRIPEPRR